MPEPRIHHRYFSHNALPQLFFQEKKKFLDSAEVQGDTFMSHLWDSLGHELKPEQRMPGADLLMKSRNHGAVQGLVTIVPPAETSGEAYYCACIGIWKEGFFNKTMKEFRYFLLERAPDHRERIRTRLVEIVPQKKTHERVDLGPGCLPDSDDFWRYILRYLETGKVPQEGGPMGIK